MKTAICAVATAAVLVCGGIIYGTTRYEIRQEELRSEVKLAALQQGFQVNDVKGMCITPR